MFITSMLIFSNTVTYNAVLFLCDKMLRTSYLRSLFQTFLLGAIKMYEKIILLDTRFECDTHGIESVQNFDYFLMTNRFVKNNKIILKFE